MQRVRQAVILCALGVVSGTFIPNTAIPTIPVGHPRLLFNATEAAALRAKRLQEPYASIFSRILSPLDNVSEPYYQPTNVNTYCDQALDGVWQIVNSSGYWANTSALGLTRAFYSRSVAIAYDLCAPSWEDWVQSTLSTALITNGYSLMLSFDLVNGLGNNHEAVRYGSAGLCFSACDVQPECAERAANAYDYVLSSLTSNLGKPSLGELRMGVNPEGEGYTAYPALFSFPFASAARRLQQFDLVADLPPAAHTHVWRYISAIPLPRPLAPDNDHIVNGLHPDFADDNPYVTLSGSLAQAFEFAPVELLPAMKWIYDRSWGLDGDASFESHRGGGLMAYARYPDTVVAAEPTPTLGRTFYDPSYGFASFRSDWVSEHLASLVQLNAKTRPCYQCHQSSDVASLRVFSRGFPWLVGAGRTSNPQGQTTLFPTDPLTITDGVRSAGTMEPSPQMDADTGTGSATASGSSTGVSGAVRRIGVSFDAPTLGAEAALVIADSATNGSARYWRLNSPEFISGRILSPSELPQGAAAGFVLTPDVARLGRDPIITSLLLGGVAESTAATLRGLLLYSGCAGAVAGRVGTVFRDIPGDPHGGGYGFGSEIYRNNTWVDFACAGGDGGDNDAWVWALTVADAGRSHPPVVQQGGTGCCDNRTITIGTDGVAFVIDAARISVQAASAV
jgi:hypothetical protein